MTKSERMRFLTKFHLFHFKKSTSSRYFFATKKLGLDDLKKVKKTPEQVSKQSNVKSKPSVTQPQKR